MTCYYCKGRHESDYCPGYHASGLRNDVSELHGAVDSLARLSDEGLGDVRSAIDSLSDRAATSEWETQALLSDVASEVGGVSREIADLSSTSREGFSKISGELGLGFGAVTAGLAGLLAVTWMGFAGLGAMLAYREQNDQRRHDELMAQLRADSDAARSARHLQLALLRADEDRTQEALQAVRQAAGIYPTWAEVHRVAALILGRAGDSTGALEAIQTAASVLSRGCEQPRQFVVDSAGLAKLTRSVHLQLAATLTSVGRVREAVAVLSAETRGLAHSEVFHQLGRLHALLGDRARASEWLVRGASASPRRYVLIASDPQLSSLGSGIEQVLRSARRSKEVEHRELTATLVSLRGPAVLRDLKEIDSTVPVRSLFREVKRLRALLPGENT